MATFTIKIDTDSDAFQPEPERELARILWHISTHLAKAKASGFYETIFDANGNYVGRWALKP